MNETPLPQKSWWRKNLIWVLPVGGCFTLILLLFVFAGTLFYGVTKAFEGSEPYEYAFEKINQDERLIASMGSPVVKNGMVQGNLNYKNNNGKADMSIPISGPNETGILYIKASSQKGHWIYHEIMVETENGKIFNIVENAPLEQFQ